MICTAFREYEVDSADFPIQVSISTPQAAPPRVQLKLMTTYVRRSDGKRQNIEVEGKLQAPAGPAAFEIPRPTGFSGVILFRVMAAMPVNQLSPYEVVFQSADHRRMKDVIFPEVVTPVFANYAMQIK